METGTAAIVLDVLFQRALFMLRTLFIRMLHVIVFLEMRITVWNSPTGHQELRTKAMFDY